MENWSMRRKLYLYPALLKELPDLDDQIRMERDRVLAAYDVGSPVMSGMPGGGGPGDPCGNTVVNQIIPGWERYSSLRQRRRAKQAIALDVEMFLDQLDALELSVVRLRYFSNLSWPSICEIEHISEATAHRLHDAARRKCKDESF